MGYILHLSDFHFDADMTEEVKILLSLQDFLKREKKYTIDYLVFTGDIFHGPFLAYLAVKEVLSNPLNKAILSGSNIEEELKEFAERLSAVFGSTGRLGVKMASEDWSYNVGKEYKRIVCNSDLTEDVQNTILSLYDEALRDVSLKQIKQVGDFFREFCWRLNIGRDSLILCCGNHDAIRFLISKDTEINCNGGSNNDEIHAFSVYKELCKSLGVDYAEKTSLIEKKNLQFLLINSNWINASSRICVNCPEVRDTLGRVKNKAIVVIHKPVHAICENMENRYRENHWNPLLDTLKDKCSLWLCGDKHTFNQEINHDIPQRVVGAPISGKESPVITYALYPNDSQLTDTVTWLEYCFEESTWHFGLREDLAKESLRICSTYLKNTGATRLLDTDPEATVLAEDSPLLGRFSQLGKIICRYRKEGQTTIPIDSPNLFEFVFEQIQARMNTNWSIEEVRIPISIHGRVSSGKSTFLGLLYHFLITKYKAREFPVLPVYFNLRNVPVHGNTKSLETIQNRIRDNFIEFCKAVKQVREDNRIGVCCLIDGLDEHDFIGKDIPYTIEKTIIETLMTDLQPNIDFFIPCWNQYDLDADSFVTDFKKNDRQYKSDVLYFNEVDSYGIFKADNLKNFISSYVSIREPSLSTDRKEIIVSNIVNNISALEVPKIGLNYLHTLYEFLKKGSRYDSTRSAYDALYLVIQRILKSTSNLDAIEKVCHLVFWEGKKYSEIGIEIPYGVFQRIKINETLQQYLIADYYAKVYANPNLEVESNPNVLDLYIPREVCMFLRGNISSLGMIEEAAEELTREGAHHRLSISLSCYLVGTVQEGGFRQRNEIFKTLSKAFSGSLEESPLSDYKAVSEYTHKMTEEWKKEKEDDKYFGQLAALRSLLVAKSAWINNSALRSIKSVKSQSELATNMLFYITFENEDYREFTRLFQRLFYGDLSVHEAGENYLNHELVGRGLNFLHYYGVVTNRLNKKAITNQSVTLDEYDLLVLCDLILNSLSSEYDESNPTFFYSPRNNSEFSDKALQILITVITLLGKFINNTDPESNPTPVMDVVKRLFSGIADKLNICMKALQDERHGKTRPKPFLTKEDIEPLYREAYSGICEVLDQN